MKYPKYKKELEYSYVLGATLVFELLQNRASDAIKIIYSSKLHQELLDKLMTVCHKYQVPLELDDKNVNYLSDKENCYVIGVCKKTYLELNDSNHLLLVNPSNAGNLGGWKILSDGLYSTNEQVGLYAGNERFLNEEDSKLNNPIRIWAGKTGDSYLFAVTEKGTLYANDAEIKGKISATGGRIENDILVGKTDNGILISGNSEGQSYISSA